MADRSVRVVLSLLATGFEQGMQKAATATDKLTGKMDAHGRALDNVGTTALLAGGAILAGVGVAAKAYADFDKQMSAVAATGDNARGSLDALRAAALKAGADTKFSATEAAEGVENLLKAGVNAKDVMGGGLAGALDLAAAGEMAVADAAETAATAMTQFGLAGQDVPHIADLLAAGAGKAQGEVSDMAAALKQGGLVANQFGLSIEETVGGLSAFASAGLIGSDAGTSMKSMLLALANPSKESARLMEELGINAYDASGSFIGMAGLAEELKTKMGGLTDAQRQQALAQIFGTDAMRAASVLYEQGAQGVTEWTSAVNDQGYAAEVAAIKMDNLAGDLERLGGSFDTALIQTGSGANDVLRSMAQGLTAIVDSIGKIPGPMLSAGVGMAALAGGGLVAVGGLTKLLTTGLELRSSLKEIAKISPRTGAALGALGKAAGMAGLAMTAVALINWAGSTYQAGVDATRMSLEDLITAAQRAGSGGGFATIDEELSKIAGHSTDLRTALGALAVEGSGAERAIVGFAESVTGTKTTLTQTRESVANLDRALTQMKPEDAARAWQALGEQMDGIPVEEQARLFPQYSAALQASARAAGEALTSGEALARSQDRTGESAKAAALAQDQMKASILAAASAALQASGSAIGLEAAIDDASAAVAANGRNLDINTEKGRANRSALDQIASAALTLTEKQKANGASSAEMAASTQRARDAFIQTAGKMGMTATEARKLADSYGLIPRAVTTNVTAVGINSALSAAASLDRQLDALAGRVVTVRVNSSMKYTVANGGMFAPGQFGLAQQFASGGYAAKIGSQQPQIQPAGGRGILWAEEGAGPWEAFISGHPGKRSRSRWIAEDVVRRLGGNVAWEKYADGGVRFSTAAPYVPAAPVSRGGGGPSSRTDIASVASAVRTALDGATLTLAGVDYLANSTAARISTSIRRGV